MKKTLFPFLLFLCVFLNAAPQSFFIPPGQVINNGEIIRGYSLEYGMGDTPSVSADNLRELSVISGPVTVVYSGGNNRKADFGELLSERAVNPVQYDSEEFLGFVFTDKTILQIISGDDGIRFFRADMSEAEEKLTRENIQKIIDLEKRGLAHSQIQELILRNRIFRFLQMPETFVVDFQTTENESEKVKSIFNNSSTIGYERDSRLFLRVDGLLSKTVGLGGNITELLTHYHSDHISQAAAERCMREGKFSRFIAPYPLLDASMTKTFFLLAQNAGMGDRVARPDNWILDISPGGTVPGGRIPGGKNPALGVSVIGDFMYSSFSPEKDITVEMFRRRTARDVNSDGLIFRITHKNVSYLLFGDFDDPAGLDEIFAISAANENRRIELKEKKAELTVQLLAARAENNIKTVSEIQGRIQRLDEELSGLFTLKADVMKWPHHAHKFPNDNTGNGIVKKMNEVVDPYFIIWQRHYTQRGFTDYIKRFDFSGKFLCSDDIEIRIVSMEKNPCIYYPL